MHVFLALLVSLTLGATAGRGAAPSDPDAAARSAMGPYYAALVASARGDRDGTERQLVLFAARWTGAADALRAAGPDWSRAAGQVRASIERAQQLVRRRDVQGAHEELEGIRLALRDARARAGRITLDDRLSDFHEELERLLARLPRRHEIALRASDLAALRAATAATRTAWTRFERATPDWSPTAAWTGALGGVAASLQELEHASAIGDADALGVCGDRLKDRYFDLLIALSREPRG